MSAKLSTRLVGLLGLAWFVFFAVGGPALQGAPPGADTPIEEVRAFFQGHGTRYLVGDFVAGCGFALALVPFAVFLPSALGTAAGDPWRRAADRAWARLTAAGAVALVVTGGVATSFLDAVAMTHGDPRLDDSTITALLYANAAGIALLGLPAAVFAAAAAMLVWRSHAPRAIAVVGGVAAALLVAGAAFPIASDPQSPLWIVRFASFVALAAFVVSTSTFLVTRRSPATS